MEQAQYQQEVLKRLDRLIAIQVHQACRQEAPTVTQTIDYLLQMGLTPSETAQVVGKPTSYVSATQSNKRRRAQKKDNNNGKRRR
jgi:hypothetical protein